MDNAVGLVNGDYHAMGAMLASMLLQSGPVLPVFNHHFLKYGNLGIEAATLETVCDTRYRDMITKVCISYSQFLASFSICLSVTIDIFDFSRSLYGTCNDVNLFRIGGHS